MRRRGLCANSVHTLRAKGRFKKQPEHAATYTAPLLCRRYGALAHSPIAFFRERESMQEAQTSKNTIIMSPISPPAVMLRKLEEKPSRPQRALESFSFDFSTPEKTSHRRRRQRFLNAFPKLSQSFCLIEAAQTKRGREKLRSAMEMNGDGVEPIVVPANDAGTTGVDLGQTQSSGARLLLEPNSNMEPNPICLRSN